MYWPCGRLSSASESSGPDAAQVEVSPEFLEATQLRLAGNALATEGDLPAAIDTYTQALQLNVAKNQHMLYANRSAAYLQLKRNTEALDDALAAVAHAPPGFHTAPLRLIDAHYACEQIPEAKTALQTALEKDPSFENIPEYKAIVAALARAEAAAAAAANQQPQERKKSKWGWFGA